MANSNKFNQAVEPVQLEVSALDALGAHSEAVKIELALLGAIAIAQAIEGEPEKLAA